MAIPCFLPRIIPGIHFLPEPVPEENAREPGSLMTIRLSLHPCIALAFRAKFYGVLWSMNARITYPVERGSETRISGIAAVGVLCVVYDVLKCSMVCCSCTLSHHVVRKRRLLI